MLKEIVEFMDFNEGIENYFLKEELKDIYLIYDKKQIFLSIVDLKSKNTKQIKILNSQIAEMPQKTIEKLIFLENNSKALPRKQLNKDKGVGGAGVFLFSLHYELINNQIIFYRNNKDVKIKEHLFNKKLISPLQGIQNQIDSGKTYIQNRNFKKLLDIVVHKCSTLVSQNARNLHFAITENYAPEKGNIKLAFLVSNNTIKKFRESYLRRKVFSYDIEKNTNKTKNGVCNICNQKSSLLASPAFLTNYGVDFSQKTSLGLDYNQLVCPTCATKLEKFRFMTENKLTNPFPLFLDNKSLFGQQIVTLNDEDKKKNFREIIKSIYLVKPKDLKNYYLLNYQSKLSSGVWKLEINDIDYIENFIYMTSFKISNFMNINNSFILNDFYNKKLSVFQFEKIINDLIFEKKLQYNYFTNYKDIKITYSKINSQNTNTLLKNYLIKYRQNFYDFVYKSYQENLRNIDFREMVLNIIKDNIKHDDNDKKGYSIYQNEIIEKLNLLLSIKNYFKKGGEPMEQGEFDKLRNKIDDSLGYWVDKKDEQGNVILDDNQKPEKQFIGGVNSIENDDKFFAYLCGQMARFLIGQKKGKNENKNHSDFNAFTDWQTSKLLKQYIYEIHRKYAHELKFRKRYDNAMSIIQTYKDGLRIEKVMEYMIAGYFAQNQILKSNKGK